MLATRWTPYAIHDWYLTPPGAWWWMGPIKWKADGDWEEGGLCGMAGTQWRRRWIARSRREQHGRRRG